MKTKETPESIKTEDLKNYTTNIRKSSHNSLKPTQTHSQKKNMEGHATSNQECRYFLNEHELLKEVGYGRGM